MVLCPLKKNLEVNLTNHVSGLKHRKASEDAKKLQRELARMRRLG